MHQILIVCDKRLPQFAIIVNASLFSVFCHYIKDNFPNIGCIDSKMPVELQLVLERGINEYVSRHPEFAGSDFSFRRRQVNSVLKTNILSDNIVSAESIQMGLLCEKHEGTVTYEGRYYSFNYEFTYDPSVTISDIYSPLFSASLLPEKKHSGLGLDLLSACEKALMYEAETIKYENELKEWEAWEDFYRANVKVFHEWFAPLSESRLACSKAKSYLKNAVISKQGIISLEKGICPFCANYCHLVMNPMYDKGHSPQWYDLKLDEIPCSLARVSALHKIEY